MIGVMSIRQFGFIDISTEDQLHKLSGIGIFDLSGFL